jgi:hypothetical protein
MSWSTTWHVYLSINIDRSIDVSDLRYSDQRHTFGSKQKHSKFGTTQDTKSLFSRIRHKPRICQSMRFDSIRLNRTSHVQYTNQFKQLYLIEQHTAIRRYTKPIHTWSSSLGRQSPITTEVNQLQHRSTHLPINVIWFDSIESNQSCAIH